MYVEEEACKPTTNTKKKNEVSEEENKLVGKISKKRIRETFQVSKSLEESIQDEFNRHIQLKILIKVETNAGKRLNKQ